jgi:quercetin dioxygenase-like cupin family protein
VLAPGAGYDPHRDAHDVAIVTFRGELQTLGSRLCPGSVVYCAAGQEHGMRNVGDVPARYLVFELQPRRRALRRSGLPSRGYRLYRRARRLVGTCLRAVELR